MKDQAALVAEEDGQADQGDKTATLADGGAAEKTQNSPQQQPRIPQIETRAESSNDAGGLRKRDRQDFAQSTFREDSQDNAGPQPMVIPTSEVVAARRIVEIQRTRAVRTQLTSAAEANFEPVPLLKFHGGEDWDSEQRLLKRHKPLRVYQSEFSAESSQHSQDPGV
ncbi:hypothetical protein R1sor_021609 [Riccia sorocarpa]|uniref:Uncharacterized protein n=1 Tax=Riccia sorocarpa TaxID=122646 RepID=A0ABD3GIA6_9MARC